jgi:hypothetical protein
MPYYYRALAIIVWTTLSSALFEHTTLLYADAQRLRYAGVSSSSDSKI